MAPRFSPDHLELIFEAAWKSFWFRDDLKSFLIQCEVAPGFFVSWVKDEPKPVMLRRLLGSLIEKAEGREVIARISELLGQQQTFPKLERHENSKVMIADAKKAVEALRNYNKGINEQTKSEQNRCDAQNKLNQEIDCLKQKRASLHDFLERLHELHSNCGTSKAGYDFQD